MANKKVLMAFLNLFKDWVFLIEAGRSFHNLGAAAAISNFVKVLLDNSSFWNPQYHIVECFNFRFVFSGVSWSQNSFFNASIVKSSLYTCEFITNKAFFSTWSLRSWMSVQTKLCVKICDVPASHWLELLIHIVT